jgi:hypothetical protein
MSGRYLRNKKDGFIYHWDPILDKNPLCEEVTEQEAFPERFINPVVVEQSVVRRRTRKAKALSLATADVPEEPKFESQDLNIEASRGLPDAI